MVIKSFLADLFPPLCHDWYLWQYMLLKRIFLFPSLNIFNQLLGIVINCDSASIVGLAFLFISCLCVSK